MEKKRTKVFSLGLWTDEEVQGEILTGSGFRSRGLRREEECADSEGAKSREVFLEKGGFPVDVEKRGGFRQRRVGRGKRVVKKGTPRRGRGAGGPEGEGRFFSQITETGEGPGGGGGGCRGRKAISGRGSHLQADLKKKDEGRDRGKKTVPFFTEGSLFSKERKYSNNSKHLFSKTKSLHLESAVCQKGTTPEKGRLGEKAERVNTLSASKGKRVDPSVQERRRVGQARRSTSLNSFRSRTTEPKRKFPSRSMKNRTKRGIFYLVKKSGQKKKDNRQPKKVKKGRKKLGAARTCGI